MKGCCNLTRKTQLFLASLAMTLIVILSLCGFALVDLSSDRYMPGQFTRIVDFYSLDASGARFSLFGTGWEITPSSAAAFLEPLQKFRALSPAGAFWGKALAEWVGRLLPAG